MCMRTVSFRVKKRFPDLQVFPISSIVPHPCLVQLLTIAFHLYRYSYIYIAISLLQLLTLLLHRQHLVDAGLMRDDELKVLQDLDTKVFRRRLICSLKTLLLLLQTSLNDVTQVNANICICNRICICVFVFVFLLGERKQVVPTSGLGD